MARFDSCAVASSHREVSSRSASRSMTSWSTSPTQAAAAATTRASASATTAVWAVAGSTVALPDSAPPGDVLFNGDGRKLVGTRVGTSQIDSFTVARDGRLTCGSRLAVPCAGARSVRQRVSSDEPGSAVCLQRRQRRRRQRHRVRVPRWLRRQVAAHRSLAVRRSPDAACWVEITWQWPVPVHRQHRIGSISRYSIAPGGALTLLGSTAVRATGGVGAVDARRSPDGRTLYVDESRVGSVGAFGVNDGDLTELASPTSLPGRRQAGWIVVD